MKKQIHCSEIKIKPDLSLFHVGPSIDFGPLPTIFYFALSGPDSLTKDPFNQPIQFLSDQWIRFFSLTLPFHEDELPPKEAIGSWAEEIKKDNDIIGTFIDNALAAVEFVISQKLAYPQKLAVAGLSRGGFIASLLAAKEKRFSHILQFAPLTDLSKTKEFELLQTHPIVQSYNLLPLAPLLADRSIRLYIGNKDTRTHTHLCFEFAMELVKNSSLRSPQIELFITPSIGHMGHGTSMEIFEQGALWIANYIR